MLSDRIYRSEIDRERNQEINVLSTLAEYLVGEFDNRAQAIESPIWFVHLRLWQRRVKLFTEDSFTIFAEQSNVLKLDQPYRQRLLRLQETAGAITVQYYQFKDPSLVRGAGQHPELLEGLSESEIERLPGCVLQVSESAGRFIAAAPPETCCKFSLQGTVIQVSLGFEAMRDRFLSYDKGINPETQQAIWGALMGAYEFEKLRSYE
ncbi:chromophore lyase CpcT/CpeT [Leptolyngbya boryana CZ1]|uniref:Chromophore lyase CpcT/CpeT n=1 Tax=Leptolyngbya boryana CZ1 TaxID=3060204 RepID=A0AA96WPR6_LEPBY|nr:chromophore lyase CpcT/CpeT [Leptolyngbya boryana]WNZ43577.1 chromophore lyase CpcT/CpeT [Leptolyngbya boryana CZ1]